MNLEKIMLYIVSSKLLIFLLYSQNSLKCVFLNENNNYSLYNFYHDLNHSWIKVE